MAISLVIDGSRHASTLHFGPLFDSGHLKPELAAVVEPFVQCARATIDQVPDGPELTVALRKLLEAKDAAVRARLLGGQPEPAGAPVDERLTAESRSAAAAGGRKR